MCNIIAGMLMYFKEHKHDEWVGTILLSGGQVCVLVVFNAVFAHVYACMYVYMCARVYSMRIRIYLCLHVQVLHRPSKKEGYCFKFAHPFRHAIHAQKVPTRFLTYYQCILRVVCLYTPTCVYSSSRFMY